MDGRIACCCCCCCWCCFSDDNMALQSLPWGAVRQQSAGETRLAFRALQSAPRSSKSRTSRGIFQKQARCKAVLLEPHWRLTKARNGSCAQCCCKNSSMAIANAPFWSNNVYCIASNSPDFLSGPNLRTASCRTFRGYCMTRATRHVNRAWAKSWLDALSQMLLKSCRLPLMIAFFNAHDIDVWFLFLLVVMMVPCSFGWRYRWRAKLLDVILLLAERK